MSWQEIEGHDKIAENFARAFARGRLEGSYLFLGPEGIGKKKFAFALAKTLLCQNLKVPSAGEAFTLEQFVPCCRCGSCRRFGAAGQKALPAGGKKKKASSAETVSDTAENPAHPDFFFVCRPPDRSTIPMELLVGAKEERMRSGLCYDLSRTPFFNGRLVAVVDDADFFSQEGANALLKTLEEPPANTLMILIGTSAARQLPTIRSRCRMVRFSLDEEALGKVLSRQGIALSADDLKSVLVAGGSVNLARQIQGEGLSAQRGKLQESLKSWIFSPGGNASEAVDLAAEVLADVEKAGKEPVERRARLRLLLTWALEFLRDQVRKYHRCEGTDISGAVRLLEDACDRTLQALEQIDRNALLPQIIESWAFDIDRSIHR